MTGGAMRSWKKPRVGGKRFYGSIGRPSPSPANNPTGGGGSGGGTPPDAAAKMIANESLKLLASNLDRASTACFTVGVVTPLAGWFYGVSGLDKISVWWLLLGFSGWLVAGIVLHRLARRVLRGLLP